MNANPTDNIGGSSVEQWTNSGESKTGRSARIRVDLDTYGHLIRTAPGSDVFCQVYGEVDRRTDEQLSVDLFDCAGYRWQWDNAHGVFQCIGQLST